MSVGPSYSPPSPTSKNINETEPTIIAEGIIGENGVITNTQDIPLRIEQVQVNNVASVHNKNLESDKYSNPVYMILKLSTNGYIQLKAYEHEIKNKIEIESGEKCSFFSHHKVSRLLIDHVMTANRSFNVSADQFDKLAKNAHALFPKYSVSDFYSNISGPRGALYSAYCSIREAAIGCELIDIKKRKPAEEKENYNDDEDFQWLQKPEVIFDDTYIKNWVTKAPLKKQNSYKKYSVSEILETFSNLASIHGYKLISADFTLFYNKTEDYFFEQWSIISEKIIIYAKNLQKRKKFDFLKPFLLDVDNLEKEHRENNSFYLLPLIFRKITKSTSTSKKHSNWSPENLDVLNNFIIHVEGTDFKTKLAEKIIQLKQFHLDHRLPWSSFFVVLNGVDRFSSDVYIMIGEHLYQMSSIKNAVCACLQCQKVFYKEPSRVSNHVWHFLELKVFGIPLEKTAYSAVTNLITDLNYIGA